MTIARIAEAANVSYATAWRIINNQPCKSEEAIEKVRRAMSQLGYDSAARAMQRRGRRPAGTEGIRTRNVALLHLREGTSISSSVLSRVQRMLADKDLNLIFAQVDSPDAIPHAVRSGNVDGILGYGQFPAEAMTPKLCRIPAVWMMSRSDMDPDPWGDRVRPDHEAIGKLAARHLLDKGHDRLGYLNPDANFLMYQQRLASFRMAADVPGATVDVFATSGTNDLDVEAERLVDLYLKSSPRPTGLFVPVDRVTLRVYHHLIRRGVQPGRDVEVVSCDHEKDLLSLMRPAPASIDLHRQTIARLAVERLFWRMRYGMTSPSVVVTVSPTLAVAGAPSAATMADGSDDGSASD
jgi:LacI family transcriptional regulator